MAIKRIWHGWTTKENADRYQDILLNKVLPGIEEKKISGYQDIEVLRKEHEDHFLFGFCKYNKLTNYYCGQPILSNPKYSQTVGGGER